MAAVTNATRGGGAVLCSCRVEEDEVGAFLGCVTASAHISLGLLVIAPPRPASLVG